MCNVAKPLQGKAPFFSLLCFIGHEIGNQYARWQKQTEYELITRYESCKQGCCHEIKDWVSTTKKPFYAALSKVHDAAEQTAKMGKYKVEIPIFFIEKEIKYWGKKSSIFFSSTINISGNSFSTPVTAFKSNDKFTRSFSTQQNFYSCVTYVNL